MQAYVNYETFSVLICSEDEKIYSWLSDDMKIEKTASAAVALKINIIDIRQSSISDETFSFRVKGRLRHAHCNLVVHSEYFELTLGIPARDSWLFKLLSSSYTSKRRQILNDFFHGTYIGLLAIVSLQTETLLLHASCVNMEQQSFVFIGGSQSGKSMLAQELVKNDGAFAVSDDMLLLSPDNNITPLQISIREPLNFKKQLFRKISLSEALNVALFSALAFLGNVKPHRRVRFNKFYYKNSDRTSKYKSYFIIFRNDVEDHLENLDEYENIIHFILQELNNLPGFVEIRCHFDKINYFRNGFENELRNKYRDLLQRLKITKVILPNFASKKEASEFIKIKLTNSRIEG